MCSLEFPQKVFQYRYVLQARCTLVINMNLLPKDSSTTFGCTHEWWICFISEENNRFMLEHDRCYGDVALVLASASCPAEYTCWCLLGSWPSTLQHHFTSECWQCPGSLMFHVPCCTDHWWRSLITSLAEMAISISPPSMQPEHRAELRFYMLLAW